MQNNYIYIQLYYLFSGSYLLINLFFFNLFFLSLCGELGLGLGLLLAAWRMSHEA